MKHIKTTVVAVLATAFIASPYAFAADATKEKKPVKPYPLEVCVVSGEKLGDMGDAYVFTYQNQEIQLCCKGCKEDFDAEAKQFMGKVEAANKKVKPYKKDVCLISGEKLGDSPRALVYKGKEVKFCCKDCEKEFRKDSKKYAAKLAE